MIRSVRAAGVAAAVFGFAATLFAAAPSEAVEGGAPEVSYRYDSHADAGIAGGDLGLNGPDQQATRTEAVAPLAAHLAAGTPDFAAIGAQMVQLAEASVPRPRSLGELVPAYARTDTADQQQDCLASAVYFEARGEPIEGQLAVAEVVMNRAASGRYPATLCEVVEQPWQFSFVNSAGRIPQANRSSQAWRTAVAIARIAQEGSARLLDRDVLWYHADYVSPSWGRRLARQQKIGLHIFYS